MKRRRRRKKEETRGESPLSLAPSTQPLRTPSFSLPPYLARATIATITQRLAQVRGRGGVVGGCLGSGVSPCISLSYHLHFSPSFLTLSPFNLAFTSAFQPLEMEFRKLMRGGSVPSGALPHPHALVVEEEYALGAFDCLNQRSNELKLSFQFLRVYIRNLKTQS